MTDTNSASPEDGALLLSQEDHFRHEINNAISPVSLYVESLLATDKTLSKRAREYLITIQHSTEDVVRSVARMIEFYRHRKPQRMLSLLDLNEAPEAVDPSDQPAFRLLLADDDAALRVALSATLSKYGHEVVQASDGSAAIAAFTAAHGTANAFSGVITDWEMPDIDGAAVIGAVRTVAPEVPVFLLTGGTSRLYTDHVVPPNIQGLLYKPPTLEELRAALAAVQPSSPTVLADSAPVGRLLVVEDEGNVLAAICAILRDRKYTVVGVESGAAALAALKDAEFDVLLTDLLMPDMDGIALLRAALLLHPDLTAIVMTANGTISGAIEALQAGAMDYMVKPFTVAKLLPVVTRALTVRRLHQENLVLENSVRRHAVELETANQELESFSYSVSHDLRAPLRMISGYAEALWEDHAAALPAEADDLIRRILAGSRRMEGLIAALLDLSTVTRQPLVRRPVDLTLLAQEAVADVRPNFPEWRGTITVGALPPGTGDPALLRQIFVNLLSNALKFTRDRADPSVEVGGVVEGEGQSYFVRDNGIGFDQSQAARTFVAFQRLHPAGKYPGSGIGLSIVQRIVARHGGRVWAVSQPDQGATFYFSLPV